VAFTETDCLRAREDFLALRRALDRGLDPDGGARPFAFLDGPAGTQVPEAVIDAVSAYYRTSNANAHGQFATSRESDQVLLAARRAMAAFLGTPDWRTISFGQNMTTLAYSLAHAFGRLFGADDEVVVTQLDHEANRGPWISLEERGVTVREVRMLPDGTLDMEDFAAAVSERTRLVAVGSASNALGTVNDVAAVQELCRRAGARLLVDAVHHAPHFPQDVAALDPDFLFCSAYKFYGPHVGVLYTRPGLLEELPVDRLRVHDTEAPWRIETGTLNHAALAGVTAAVEYLASWGEGGDLRARVVSAMDGIAAYEHGLAREYFERVREIPGVTVWGPGFDSARRAPTVSITLDGVPAVEVARRLGEEGVQVWDGDFYALRPVEVLGLVERGGLLRTGFSLYNTRDEAARLVDGLRRIVHGR
jgi:cysteine desulfurase family protein (TIGR01976 family)